MRTSLFKTGATPPGTLAQIRRLLDECFDGEFSDDDWEHTLGGWHVVVVDDGTLLSHAACVPRLLEAGGRPLVTGYVEGVGTIPGRRHEGLASLALFQLGSLICQEFEMGALSTGSYDLYGRLGWERWRGPTFARRDRELIRTEEDDDSLMVLRFGPSLGLDLAGPISCGARTRRPLVTGTGSYLGGRNGVTGGGCLGQRPVRGAETQPRASAVVAPAGRPLIWTSTGAPGAYPQSGP